MFSGALLLWQMSDWQSIGTRRYPALFILHVAFAWTPTALILGGLSAILTDQIPADDALHALTMGAMGTMIAAFMMRPAMFRNGESLILGRAMAGAFSLVSLSALLRISGGWLDQDHFEPDAASAICWMAGWTLYLIAYLPAMSGPVPRPAFSAALGSQVERGNGKAGCLCPQSTELPMVQDTQPNRRISQGKSDARATRSKWRLHIQPRRARGSFPALNRQLSSEHPQGTGDQHGRARRGRRRRHVPLAREDRKPGVDRNPEQRGSRDHRRNDHLSRERANITSQTIRRGKLNPPQTVPRACTTPRLT